MKVLMVSWEYPPISVGGLASHVNDLSTVLVEEGVEIHLVTQGGEEADRYEQEEGVNVYRVNKPEISTPDFLTWVMLVNFNLLEVANSLLDEYEFNLIHTHDWLVGFTGKSLKYSHHLPLVATIHATESGRNNGIYNSHQKYINDVEWLIGYEAWRLICCSQYMKEEIHGLFQTPKDKIDVINNGVDLDTFDDVEVPMDFKEKYTNGNLIFFIGRIVREKGVQVLLEAAPKILSATPDTQFVIAGKGPMLDELKSQVYNFGIADNVTFTGYISEEEKERLYQVADVAVFPSLYEPFGIVALEAMASKTPVVVSGVGGLDEIIEDGRDGLKALPGNANSLAEKIIKLLTDQDYANSLQKTGYRKAVEDYSWQGIARKTKEVYQQVLDEYQSSSWKNEGLIPKI
ncbi:glycosyltransferase family 4 protein [Selenihalanaerobacter shriftii]|uniref:Glycosyltransferase involved in cell wall bisynthesis n=1 Tax=Selenihalanaerobacter shriftii TaxID=142842 RepID=A0A1T4KHP0_9FIRM|nr:glycosyltransferase family 4 protein [Selenihalanaerobacter shriftii]SJZ41940.1 Glycosyltransferase involved in cell wall bisynthesis [Selenihalanaerobacter shriftii]